MKAGHATSYPRHVPAPVLSCRVRRKAARRWRLRSSWAVWYCAPRAFRLRVAVTGDAATVPPPATELAGGGSWETPAGGAAPGIGSTVLSAACWRTRSRKEVINSAEGGAAPVGDRPVPSSSGATPGGRTAFPIGEESMSAREGACEARRAVTGGVVVCGSCWCAMRGAGGCAPPPTCATSGPRGEGMPLAEGRGDVRVRDRGAALPLSPAL